MTCDDGCEIAYYHQTKKGTIPEGLMVRVTNPDGKLTCPCSYVRKHNPVLSKEEPDAYFVIDTCVIGHEFQHHIDAANHLNGGYIMSTDCPRVKMVGTFYGQYFLHRERECRAYTVELNCLKNGKKVCNGNVTCIQVIDKWIKEVEDNIHTYCTWYGLIGW